MARAVFDFELRENIVLGRERFRAGFLEEEITVFGSIQAHLQCAKGYCGTAKDAYVGACNLRAIRDLFNRSVYFFIFSSS